MRLSLSFQTLGSPSSAESLTPLLAVFAVDTATASDADPAPALLHSPEILRAATQPWLSTGEFKATLGETLLLHRPSGVPAERLLVIGLGKLKSLHPHQLRKGAGTAVRSARTRRLKQISILFPDAAELTETLSPEPSMAALAEGALLADFEIDTYRSDRKDLSLDAATLLSTTDDDSARNALRRGFKTGEILGASQNFARSLVNEPGNVLTPTELGRRASAMAAEVGLSCEIHSTEKLQELGMGAFLAVAQGSTEPPALIVLRYEPPTPPPDGTPVLGLVGKGITFDTGGISIKPGEGMEKMKYDMAGAAAMLGAIRALALLQPACRILSVICSTENMPDGRAYKPGDVLRAMSGKTIEVLNTDAEGRLVLADGLHYARELGATHLVNAATLTGAIGVALGLLNVGLFSNDDPTADKFLAASTTAGEPMWRMPCTDDYREQIRSSIADIMNTGNSRYGGAISAAMFLKEFVGDTPWVHLDIASTAWTDTEKPWQGKGPTGIAVRSIAEWVLSYTR